MKQIENSSQVIRELSWSLYFEVSAWDTHKDEYYHECEDQLPLEDLLHALVNDISHRIE